MVQASNSTPSILVMGTLGIGKSTLHNKLGATFQTSSGIDSCTKDLQATDSVPGFKLIDSPGLHDLEMNIPEWAGKVNTSVLAGTSLNLCLLVFKATYRPEA